MLILLLAWLSFDLATPLPGAFEFEADDSEIEDSIHVRREARGGRAAGTERVTPQARAEQQPTPTRRVTSRLRAARRSLGDEWRRTYGSPNCPPRAALRPPKPTSFVIPSVS